MSQRIVEFLAQTRPFAGLSVAERAAISATITLQTVAPQTVIIEQGSTQAGYLFILGAGRGCAAA